MNRALWKKTIREASLHLGLSLAVLFGFAWLFVWISSKMPINAMLGMLEGMPEFIRRMVPAEARQFAQPETRVAIYYMHPLVLLTVGGWAIARGSDVVAGELGRGTLEMVLGQPVRRISVLWTHSVVTVAGAALMALVCWLGTWAGTRTVDFPGALPSSTVPLAAGMFWPAAANLFALAVFLAGVSTLASSLDQYRWRVIGLVIALYMVSFAIKITGEVLPDWNWLAYTSFLASFEPVKLVADPSTAGPLSVRYDCTLIGLALAAYTLAALVFCRRDLPAPI